MKTPDITPAQAIALVGALVNLAVQFGVDLNAGQQHALLAVAGVLATVVLGDAHIRNGRAQVLAAAQYAAGEDE